MYVSPFDMQHLSNFAFHCPQVFLEDAGFDWKVMGPDVSNMEYVAWVCDQDAYACSGQKCSAQSMLFMHKNWAEAGESSSVSVCHLGRKSCSCQCWSCTRTGWRLV